MRGWCLLFAAAGTLVWSNLALAAAPTTDGSSNEQNGTRLQRKEAMVTSKKSGKSSHDLSTKNNKVKANRGSFKITENELPRPRDRVFFSYNYYDAFKPQYFVGANVSGDFQQTNFAVAPPFTVNSSGAMGGLFGGALFPVPNTNISIGPRLGWEGGFLQGGIVAPPASPFTYKVTTNSMFYQEAMVKIPVPLFADPRSPPVSPGYPPALLFPFVTASAGVAEVHTEVKGTLGAFSVVDSGYRPGITLTAGLGVPVDGLWRYLTAFNPAPSDFDSIDLLVQWRGTMTTATVNIPGAVPQAYWVNGIEFGIQLRY